MNGNTVDARNPRGACDGWRCSRYWRWVAVNGDNWDAWNVEMRDFLIATQAMQGPAKGSWFYQNMDETGYRCGGRLYATTLAAMTLEVYYRYLPLYDEKKNAEVEFELD